VICCEEKDKRIEVLESRVDIVMGLAGKYRALAKRLIKQFCTCSGDMSDWAMVDCDVHNPPIELLEDEYGDKDYPEVRSRLGGQYGTDI